MQHEVIKEILLSLGDGELDQTETELITSHMNDCAECRAVFKRWELIRSAFSAVSMPEPFEEFINQTMNRIAALEKPVHEPREWALPRWLLLLIGYGFAIILCLRLLKSGNLLL